jgi:outer membrane protein assembly factor BamB
MRRWGLAALVLAVIAAVGLYRVFAPDQTVSTAVGPPPAPPDRPSGVVGTLPWMPLFVDGRLRVYADGRQVHADGPIDFRVQTTPYWSLRRWPARVDGIVAVGPTVVSRWSDGTLVAVDARTGEVRWEVSDVAATGLHTAGDLILVVTGADVRAYRSSDGWLTWRQPSAGCGHDSFTAVAGLVGLLCDGRIRFLDTANGEERVAFDAAGPVTPLGCGAARSDCGGVRIGGQAWLLDARTPVEAPALAAAGVALAGSAVAGPAAVAGSMAVAATGAEVVGVDARTGAERWRRPVDGSVIATQPGRVHVLTGAQELLTLDAATGASLSRFPFVAEDLAVGWDPGATYAADGYVATDRLHEPEYPYPVILAAT